MDREQALRGVDLRMGALLLARSDPPLTGTPIPSAQLPWSALPPDEKGIRVCRGMNLVVPPGVDVFRLFADEWQRAGFELRSWTPPVGPTLVGCDPGGFLLVLQQRGGQVLLYVVSPLLSSGTNAALIGGLVVGGVMGLCGPIMSLGVLGQVLDGKLAFLGFVPVLGLLGGALAISPDTRPFGVGLLIGAAATGIISGGLCSGLLAL
ncbi:hypothetical protein AB0J80_20020 [Actinoplanes sp. NPDC049548]|uniref:hypothetical protein n=1 Tax=Actinoplanes sp. NPDC049548 TaxID=3155152 RepID=UPI003425DD7B